MQLTIVLLALVLIALISNAEACGSRRRRPPPPPPPPPGAPAPPPELPAVVKVTRERVQEMSRNNCRQVAIEAQTDASLANAPQDSVESSEYKKNKAGLGDNECLNAENFRYECEFSVFSEIALTTIYHPTGCGCAFTISVVTPRPVTPNVNNLISTNAAYSTEITRFAMVVYDVVAKELVEEIPEFSDMTINEQTAQLIKDQLKQDPGADMTSVTAGFAGKVTGLEQFPATLNKNVKGHENNVPAIMFSIKQIYKSGAMFKVPCTLEMHTAPNAYMSQCQPFKPDMPFSYRKRAALEVEEEEQAPVAWFREFYLFPKQSNKCGVSGYQPKSRYITAIYNGPDCKSDDGYAAVDREFTSEFKSSQAVAGGWEWTRTFSESRMVYGVPKSFSSLTATWCLGYSQITWHSPTNFAPNPKLTEKGVCSALVTSGEGKQFDKYKETHTSYPVNGLQCSFFTPFAADTTLMAFQNRNSRDFSRYLESTMVTGPRTLFGQTADQAGAMRVVFDTLTFRGVNPGEALAKRNWDDSQHPQAHEIHMVYDEELGGLIHGRHAPELVHKTNKILRKRAEEPMYVDPVANPPHRDNFGLNNAVGSVDDNGGDGANSGDHPIQPFPETYSAPLTLDPVQAENEPDTYDAEEVTGTPPKFCNKGEVGCSCRPDTALTACDSPNTCNSLGYCVPEACPVGQAGCKAHSNGDCDAPLVKGSDGYCVYKPSCTAGELGCVCDAQNACSTGDCLDGVCIRPQEGVCSLGEAGCPCSSNGSCSNSAAKCDRYTGLCLFESCQVGARGCRCQKTGAACDDGFTCNSDGNCIKAECVPGSAGCSCLASRKCNKKGYKCVELTRDGSETACVGEDLCSGDQTQRCIDECGPGNVAVCGKCSYSQPICRDPAPQYCNPKSILYKVQPCETAPASSLAASMTLAVLALVALLF